MTCSALGYALELHLLLWYRCHGANTSWLWAGLVRSPISTTAIQVTSRLVLVHLIVHPFPGSTTISPFYTSMLLAWSASEVIRYSYFVQTLRGADPGPLTWLRYNTFYVLYPVGIASEMANIYLATGEMEGWERLGAWIVLGIYVPGRS